MIFAALTLAGASAAWRLGWIRSAVSFLGAPVATARWLFWLLLSVSSISVSALIIAMMRREVGPDWHTYTTDTVFGMVWRWSYENNRIENPRCYCPSCDMVLVYSTDRSFRGYGDSYNTTFSCERCKQPVQIVKGTLTNVIGRLERHIDHAIRTGAWQRSQRT